MMISGGKAYEYYCTILLHFLLHDVVFVAYMNCNRCVLTFKHNIIL